MKQHKHFHPLIVEYENTLKSQFPLILVFGREPNNNIPYKNLVGKYDFDKDSHSAFWNMSYKFIGKQNNLSTSQLKEECRERKSSIICITNCMPKPILNKIKNKNSKRRDISPEEIKKHIQNIFSKPIIKRVKIIVLSGVNKKIFFPATNLIKKLSNKKNIRIIEVPYFASRLPQKMKLNKRNKSQIVKIYKNWSKSK